jgi:hypothetical protein
MPPRNNGSALMVPIIGGLLLVFVVTGLTAWRDKSPTFDEPLHFMGAWVQDHYDDFRCDPEDPPLWRYYFLLGTSKDQLKVSTSGVVWDSMLNNRAVEGLFFKDTLFHTPENNHTDGLIFAARSKMILLGALLGAMIAWWAWRWGGPWAALIACAAFCFDPNFLAYSPLIKNDVPIALALLVFMAAVWLIGRQVTLFRWIAVSLAVGATLNVKFSGVVTLPLLALCLLVRALMPRPWPAWKWTARNRSQRLLLAAGLAGSAYLIAYGMIWACYRFRFGPATDPNQLFDFAEFFQIIPKHQAFAHYNSFVLSPEQLRDWYAHWKPGVLFRVSLWAAAHRLLPQTWIEGFLFTFGTAPGRASLLLGRFSMAGRWDYFPVAMAVKTPLATLTALAVAIAYWLIRRRFTRRWWDLFALAIMPVSYMILAMRSDLNLGLRHVLPVYPPIFIFLGITAADAIKRWRRAAGIVAAIFLLGLLAECYTAYPDFIPFFNLAAGGWRNGPHLLGGSNVDWGQELPALARWQHEHSQFQLFLDYAGSDDPRYYGIHYVNLPPGSAPQDETPSSARPRVFAISGAALDSPWYSAEEKAFFRKLESRQPIAVLGHCMYLYRPQ